MGNRIFRGRRNPIEERHTRPQTIDRELSNVDYKKLKKLIISQKLAPCFDALEDSNSNSDLEECPICFSFYPSLNRSRCCSKGICTECFLQMTPSDAFRSAQCPFCKSSNYAVEYRGSRTQEEKGQEQAEEQKVIEAKIRMQYQESQTTDQVNASNERLCPVEVRYQTEDSLQQTDGWMQDVGNSNLSLHGRGIEVSQFPFPNAFSQRHVEFGLHADKVMLMEAIWQSIQDNSIQSSSQEISDSYGVAGSQIQTYGSNQGFPYQAMIGNGEVPSQNSVTGGVASVIAKLAQSNMLQSGTFHSINDNVQTSQIHDEHFIDSQHNNFQPTLPVDAGMLQMRIQCPPNLELYEATSENDCLASCSSTEDDSWDSLSYHIPESSQGSQDKFVSDLVKEEDLDDTSSCSSVHTISDVSCGSPHWSDMYEGQSLLSSPIAVAKHQCSFAGYLL